ncbi:MAG: DUF6268 family outer membrane beta-barrel protein [Saprospiraceae bacterium]
MKYYLLICLCLFSEWALIAQTKPNFFPEDIPSTGVEQVCFCKPGVSNKSKSRGLEISYTWLGKSSFISEEDEVTKLSTFNTLQNVSFSVKIPIIYKPGFALILGYKYASDYYNFEDVGTEYAATFQEMEEKPLKRNAFDIIMTKSLDEKRYLAGRLGYSANGNYTDWLHFDQQYSIFKFLGLYAIKPNENFEWGFGISGSKSFRRTSFIPFIVYNKTFNNKWGIESIFPGYINGRYNINPANILLFGSEYDSKSYRLNTNRPTSDNLDYALNHSGIVFSAQLDHQFSPWVWANIKVGYRFNLDSEFMAKNPNTFSFDADVSDAPFLQIGLFVTPPENFKE